jgi:hypothetical protein
MVESPSLLHFRSSVVAVVLLEDGDYLENDGTGVPFCGAEIFPQERCSSASERQPSRHHAKSLRAKNKVHDPARV